MEYHKINAPYKRWRKDLHDASMLPKGTTWNQFKIDEFSLPEFEYLFDNDWTWIEKLDGTNIRLYFDLDEDNSLTMIIKGRTDKAEIPADLRLWLQDWFLKNEAALRSTFVFPVILYGEGVGKKIQKGGLFGEQHFKLFDIKIGDFWLKYEDVANIAANIKLDNAKLFYVGSMRDAIELVKSKPKSTHGDFVIEGFVGTPTCNLMMRNGERLITKLKVVDFK